MINKPVIIQNKFHQMVIRFLFIRQNTCPFLFSLLYGLLIVLHIDSFIDQMIQGFRTGNHITTDTRADFKLIGLFTQFIILLYLIRQTFDKSLSACFIRCFNRECNNEFIITDTGTYSIIILTFRYQLCQFQNSSIPCFSSIACIDIL